MCLNRFLLAIALVSSLGSLGFGQTLLDKVESKVKAALGGAAPATDPTDDRAAPPPGYLGLVADDSAEAGKGVRVMSTKAQGPAEKGGLKADDLITAIDGKPITNLADLDAILDRAVVGQKLRVTVERGTKLQSLTITLGDRPAAPAAASEPGTELPPAGAPALVDPTGAAPADPTTAPADPTAPAKPIRSKPLEARPLDLGSPPAEPDTTDPAIPAPRSVLNPATDPASPPATATPDALPAPAEIGGRPSLGITVVPLTDEDRAKYGLTVRRGALITNVRPGSPADTAGMPIGGVVVAIDGRRIDTADDLVGIVRASRVNQEVELTYYEGDRLARKSVRLAPAAAVAAAPPTGGAPDVPPATDSLLPRGLGGAQRPLLDKVERAIEGFAAPRGPNGTAPRGPSTVYDPSEMAALRDQVLMLEEKVTSLEDRIKLLEAKLGETPPAANPLAPANP